MLRLAAACMLVAGVSAGPALADSLDTLNVVIGHTLTYDSNLLRLPADPKSDTIRTTYLGLRIDKTYSQQQFQIDFTDTRSRYDNFPERNANTIDYRAAWLWHLTPRISGTLETSQVQAQVEGDETLRIAKNVRTTKTRDFSLDGSVFGGWHLLFGVAQREQKSESVILVNPDFRSIGMNAGVRYEAKSGASISVIQYDRKGEFLSEINFANFLDNRYHETESELKVSAKPSGHSNISGRLARLQRRYERFEQRDYSGLVGGFDYNWTPTGKLRVDASAKRSFSATRELLSSFRVENLLSLAPSWQASEKIAVRLRFDRSTIDYRGPVIPPRGPLRHDTMHTVKLSADWEIARFVTLSASVQKQRRSSNYPLFEFEDTLARATAAISF